MSELDETQFEGDSAAVGWICTADALVGGMILMLILALTTAGALQQTLARVKPFEDPAPTIAALREQIAERDRRIAELDKLLAQARADVERITRERDEKETLLASARERIDHLEGQLREASRVEAQLKTELASTKTKLETAQAELKIAQDALKATQAKLAEAETDRDELRRKLERALAEIARLGKPNKPPGAPISPGIHQELLGIKGDLKKVVFILDHSGSMNITSTTEEGKTRWQYCLGIVKTWARHLEMDECVLIVFSDGVRIYPDSKIADGPTTFTTSNEAGRRELGKVLDALPAPAGQTNTPEALERALQVPGVGCVILFTDGKPEKTGASTETLQNDVYKLIEKTPADGRVKINVVGLGDYFKPELSSFLMRVSELTGGVFIGR